MSKLLSAIKINSHIRSCGWVCANSRAWYQVGVVFNSRGTLRREIDDPAKHRLVPRLPKQQSTQRECTTSKTKPSDSKALLCLSVAVAGPLGEPLSHSTQHPAPPLPALLSLAPCSVPAPIRTFVEGAHNLAAVPYCMRVSLLLLLLQLATGGTGVLCRVLCVSRYYRCCCCRYVGWVIYIRALSTLKH